MSPKRACNYKPIELACPMYDISLEHSERVCGSTSCSGKKMPSTWIQGVDLCK